MSGDDIFDMELKEQIEKQISELRKSIDNTGQIKEEELEDRIQDAMEYYFELANVSDNEIEHIIKIHSFSELIEMYCKSALMMEMSKRAMLELNKRKGLT